MFIPCKWLVKYIYSSTGIMNEGHNSNRILKQGIYCQIAINIHVGVCFGWKCVKKYCCPPCFCGKRANFKEAFRKNRKHFGFQSCSVNCIQLYHQYHHRIATQHTNGAFQQNNRFQGALIMYFLEFIQSLIQSLARSLARVLVHSLASTNTTHLFPP